jgi:carbon storage regulator
MSFMLVLSRKKDETIVINGSIKVTIVEIRGDKVRLGIEAPRDVVVHRQEVLAAIADAQSPLLAETIVSEPLPVQVN